MNETQRGWSAHESFRIHAGPTNPTVDRDTFAAIQRLYTLFLNTTDLDALMKLGRDDQRREIERVLTQLIKREALILNPHQESQVIAYILNEALGYGPLSPLMMDGAITEIMVNGPDRIYVERRGVIERVEEVAFQSEKHLLALIDRIVSRVGRRIDEASPRVDARLDDGSRVNVLIPPLSLDGPILTIRKFQGIPFSLDDLVELGMLSHEMAEFLKAAVQSRLSILVVGGTGTGKTTLLNALAEHIHASERIITIEDSAELKFHHQHPHVVRTETRPPNMEGSGQVTIRELLRNALRMRPNRIIIGEVRGAEALDMLQAMNTGHEGSMTSLHADSPNEALSRLEVLVMQAENADRLPSQAIREQITNAIDLIVQITRFEYENGADRKITSISEVQEMRQGDIVVRDIFRFDVLVCDATTRKVTGRFDATGVIPAKLPRLEARGAKQLRPYFRSRLLEEEIGEYLRDDRCTEIMINGARQAYVERRGEALQPVPIEFQSDAHLIGVIKSILAPLGLLLDERHPMVDARLPDGSRVNAVIPPVARFGPTLTVRRFPKDPLVLDELVRGDSLSPAMADFLTACVRGRLNILVAGGTGTGKTTLLNALSGLISPRERLITIEDVAELRLQHDHWVRLEARPVDQYGEGRVTIRDLVINALRMRPDRIIVGEVRGPEALDMLQAMNTGHEGSMTTVHANSPQDAFLRLETMAMWAGIDLPLEAVRRQISSALDIIVQITRFADGKRRVTAIAEVIKESAHPQVREIFAYRASEDVQVLEEVTRGQHVCVERAPYCLPRLAARGVRIALHS